MGELLIHIKVLKNSPILFTWYNKKTDNVEGCLVTCKCQRYGLKDSSGQSERSAGSPDPIDQRLLGHALKKADIFSTPGGVGIESVHVAERNITEADNQEVSENEMNSKGSGKISFFTGTFMRLSDNPKLNKTLFLTFADDTIGPELDNKQRNSGNDNDGVLSGDLNVQSDENVGSDMPTKKDTTEAGKVTQQGADVDRTSMQVVISQSGVLENGDKGTEDASVEEEEAGNGLKEDVENPLEEGDESNLNGEKSLGTNANSVSEEEEICKMGDTFKTTAGDMHSHQGEYARSKENLQETSENVEKDSEDPMEVVEGALYDVLKSLTYSDSADGKQHSDDTNQLSENANKDSPMLDIASLSQAKAAAMLKYKKYENEQYLRKLHRLGEQERVHAVICELCGAVLSSSGLKKHMSIIHSSVERERNFECSTCHKKFLRARNLKRHQITHTDQRVKCRFCEKTFKYDYTCKAHEKIHLPNPPALPVPKPNLRTLKKCRNAKYDTDRIFTCHICGKSVYYGNKSTHLQTHKERKHHCKVCDFKCRTPAVLRYHMKTHTNERNIPCRICGELFKRYQERINHERIHTGEKPFICYLCDKRWRDRTTYLSHMRKHHPGTPLMYLQPPVVLPSVTVTTSESSTSNSPEEA